MDKSIIVFCPNPYSLYTLSVCELLIKKGYNIDCIVVRKFTIDRFFNEFSRDGIRLLKKIWKKLFLKESAYKGKGASIKTFRARYDLSKKSIKEFKPNGTKIVYCNTLNDEIVEDTLRLYSKKLIVFTGGGIIRKNILDLSGDGIINCHMGILPRYKGMDLPEWCILEDRPEELGVTYHFMDSGIDTGAILKKIPIPLGIHRDIKSLRNSFEPIMIEGMVRVVNDYLKGKIIPESQGISDRRQYFIVHKRLYSIVNKKLKANL